MAKFKKRHNPFALARARSVRPVVIRQTRIIKAKRRHRRGGGGGVAGVGLVEVGIAAVALNYVANNVASVKDMADKLPGSKTFGTAATIGLVCLAVDRFAYKSKYLRAAGLIGVVLAASTIGTKGTDFQWMGEIDTDDGIIDSAA